MCFNKKGDISTLNGGSLKLVDKFSYLESSISSTENCINVGLAKAWTAIDRLLITQKSNLSNKIKRIFFQVAVVSILLYGSTTWTLTKRIEKKLDEKYTRTLQVKLKKSRQQHPTKQQLYGHQPSVSKTIQIRRTRSKNRLRSNILPKIPLHRCASIRRSTRTCRGVMVKAMDSEIVISEFELQSHYYGHFRTNTLGKSMNPLNPPSYGLSSTTTVLLEGCLCIK